MHTATIFGSFMIKFFCLWFIGFIVVPVYSQNFAVRLGAAADGTIQNWPVQVQPIGTNKTVASPFLLMTKAHIAECMASNQPAMAAWESNKTWQTNAKRDANLARIVALFNQIPAARSNATFIQSTSLTNVATISAAVKMEANILDGILEELQRLGPVLKQIYRPEEDE